MKDPISKEVLYKKQITELQYALDLERRKTNAMAKGLLPREYKDNFISKASVLSAIDFAFQEYYDKGLTNTAASVREKILGAIN